MDILLYNCLLYDPWLYIMTSSFRLTYFEKGEPSYLTEQDNFSSIDAKLSFLYLA